MATQNQDTIQNILQVISDYRGETSTNTDSGRIRAVSRQESAIANRMFWRLFHLKDQTMSGTGSNDYTIGSATFPYRPKGLSELFVGGTTEDKRYEVVDYQKYKNEYNKNNSARLVYEWYDATNDLWKIHINPAPSASDTITYSFFWTPPARTQTSDVVYCIDMEALARMALAEIYESEDEDDKAISQRQVAEQIISGAMGVEEAPAVGQLYTMGAIENSIRPRGIGNY